MNYYLAPYKLLSHIIIPIQAHDFVSAVADLPLRSRQSSSVQSPCSHCATVGFSDVTSANVVGYMNKVAENASGYTWMANTFEKVDGSVTKLSDFAISESQLPTAINLYLLSKTGATGEDAQGRKQKFVFVHPARCTTANGWVSGWYFAALNGTNVAAAQFKLGSASAYWANEVDVPSGQGFGIYRTTVNATLKVPSPLVDNE